MLDTTSKTWYLPTDGSTLQNQPSSSTHPTLPPTSTDLPSPTHLSSSPSLSTHSHKVWPAVLAILLTCAGLVTIASIIFIAVMIYIYCRNCKKTRLPQSQLKNTGARTVLVYSMDTKEQQRWQATSSEMRPLPAGQKWPAINELMSKWLVPVCFYSFDWFIDWLVDWFRLTCITKCSAYNYKRASVIFIAWELIVTYEWYAKKYVNNMNKVAWKPRSTCTIAPSL